MTGEGKPSCIKSPARERVKLCPEAEEAYYRYAQGMLEGDLELLGAYLAAGHPMDHALRKKLVEAIDGNGDGGLFTLRLTKNRPGAGTALSRRRTLRKQGEIVAYYLQLPHERGQKTQAIMDTALHFGVERTKVTDALKAAGVNDKGRPKGRPCVATYPVSD